METYLFVFGYEAPDEWAANRRAGTDDESSFAVWIEADDIEVAERRGRSFAEEWVASLFDDAAVEDFPGWSASGYASWIEADPTRRWSAPELQAIPTLQSDGSLETPP